MLDTCIKSVDLPIPGSPPTKTKDPFTIPPPKTLSNSSIFVVNLSSFTATIEFILIGFELDLSITKTAINESTGEEKINYDFSKNEYNVTYKIAPVTSNLSANNSSITGINLKVEDTLPAGMSYAVGTCDYGEPEVTQNSDGTTTLTWYIYGVTAGEEIEPITYQAHIDELTSNGTILESSVVISEVPDTDSEGNKTYKVGNTEISNRKYTTSIQVINLSSYSLYKTTETPVIEINGDIHYKITAINKTDDAISDFQLLDILPYNGDGRGTSYNGTYTVENIEIKQTNIATDETIDNSNLNLYITSEESVRTGVTAKDENLGTISIWTTIGASLAFTIVIHDWLLPSLYEGLPVVVVEAQAAGLKCVISENVPTPDLMGLVKIVKLTDSDEIWAKNVLEENCFERSSAQEYIRNGNYDIATETKKLELFYLNHTWKV